MKRSALRAALGSACAVLALVGGLILAGCSGTNPEDAIREDVTSTFDSLENMDEDTIAELAEGFGSTGLESYGIDTSELIKQMVDGFDYSIDSVAVDGDTATATVTVTSKSMSELLSLDQTALQDSLMEAISAGEIDINDEDTLNAWVGEYMMSLVEEIEPSEKTLELLYTNGDDGWEMDASSATEMNKIFV